MLQVKGMIIQLVVVRLSLFQRLLQMIAIDLSKQQALNADPRAIQPTNFTANLDRAGWIEIQQCSSILKKQKKLFLNFHKELWNSVECNFIEYKL